MLDGFLPPEMAKLALNVLNYTMFLGGSLVKLPQIIAILKTMRVEGVSEASLTMEFTACVFFCAYNLLKGHPFKTWGEMAMITIQCAVQIGLFWMLTKQKLPKLPRVAGATLVVFMLVSFKQLPEELHMYIGLIPTILGTVSRLPQIVMNLRQQHTSNLSVFTWGLSGCGNTVRIVTTVLTINDRTQLFGHIVAWLLNWSLVAQIMYYRKATQEFLAGESSKSTKIAVKEDTSTSKVSSTTTTSAQRRGATQKRSVSPGASSPTNKEEPKDK